MNAEQGERAQNRHEQIPFGHQQERIDQARSRLVERLEWRQPPNAMIDAARPPPHIRDAVHPARPFEMAGGVVFFRPFLFQQRLGFSVALLLAQIGANGVAAMMPNHGRGAEAQRPPALLQAPADIHVVPRDPELGIKSSDRLEA